MLKVAHLALNYFFLPFFFAKAAPAKIDFDLFNKLI